MVILKLLFPLPSNSAFSKCHDNVMKTILLPQGFGIALKVQVVWNSCKFDDDSFCFLSSNENLAIFRSLLYGHLSEQNYLQVIYSVWNFLDHPNNSIWKQTFGKMFLPCSWFHSKGLTHHKWLHKIETILSQSLVKGNTHTQQIQKETMITS